MSLTLGFDVYGTLIDTHGVKRALREHLGELAEGFSRLWREKQLEYSLRRGLMQNYVDFSRCKVQALEYACLEYGLVLFDEQWVSFSAITWNISNILVEISSFFQNILRVQYSDSSFWSTVIKPSKS